MAHDSSKIVLAAALSNHKDICNFDVDPAGFPAGLVVSLASTGLPSLLKSAGMRYGISRGKAPSNVKQTAVQQAGLRSPVRAALKRSTGLITITNITNLAAGDTLTVGATGFVGQAGAVTPGQATFQSATSTTATAASLAAQINAHATASTLVYAVASGATVRLYAKAPGATTGHDVAVSYTDASPTSVGLTLSELSGGKLAGGSNTISDVAFITVGAKMYVNDVTGEADAFGTITDAIYVTGVKTGITEDGTEVPAALVDFQGGL